MAAVSGRGRPSCARDQMIRTVSLFAAHALLATAADAAPIPKDAPKTAVKAKRAATKVVAAPAPQMPIVPSAEGQFVADWIVSSGDNRALPYAVIDKKNASIILYSGKGVALAQEPVLIGIALGDDASPGVGSKKLGDLGPAEKTTPAGRYLAKFGYASGRQQVLWVDYTNSVAIHAIPADAAKKEKRRERMLSPEPDDNRITFGCINVPRALYVKLRPMFQKKGGYVYIMPDVKPLEEVFPRLRVHALKAPAASD